MRRLKQLISIFIALQMLLMSCAVSMPVHAQGPEAEYLAEEAGSVQEDAWETEVQETVLEEIWEPEAQETAAQESEAVPDETEDAETDAAGETVSEENAGSDTDNDTEENDVASEAADPGTTEETPDTAVPEESGQAAEEDTGIDEIPETTPPAVQPEDDPAPTEDPGSEETPAPTEEGTSAAAQETPETTVPETTTPEETEPELHWQVLTVTPKEEEIRDPEHPSALWKWVGRCWSRLFQRPIDAEEKASETKVEISGMLPENAYADVKVIGLLEDEIYQDMGLYAYKITVFDAYGREFVPDDRSVIITVRSEKITKAQKEGRSVWVYTYADNSFEGQWEYNAATEWDNIWFETKTLPLCLFVTTYDADFKEEESAEPVLEEDLTIYAGDNIYLTGSMPADGIVQATPVDVQIEGQVVLAAYDIAIYADEQSKEEGVLWQPEENTVQVHIVDPELNRINSEEVSVYGLQDMDAEAQLSDSAQIEADEVVIDAGESSIVVIAQQLLEKTITINGATYMVMVTYDTTAGIPEGAELSVTDVTEDSGEYYLAQAADVLGWKEEDSIFYARLLDIRILYEGEEVQPAAPVTVSVELQDIEEADVTAIEAAQALEVVHFHENEEGTQARSLDSVASAEGTSCDVSFETEGFSKFVIAGVYRSVLTRTTDLAEISVQSLSKDLELDMEAIEADETVLVKGQVLLESYAVNRDEELQPDPAFIRANITLGEDVSLDQLESVDIYSVRDGALEEMISQDMEPGTKVTVSLNDLVGFALVKDTGLRELTLAAEPEIGQSIVLEGMMPKDAELQAAIVEEITASGDEENGSADEIQDAEISEETVLCAYDISIINNGEKFQPKEGETIAVEITNDLIGEAAEQGRKLSLWHITDDGEREEITEFAVVGSTVKFEAAGFSIYEIVDGPEPLPPSESVVITSLSEIEENQGYYFSIVRSGTNYMTESETGASSTTGTGTGEFLGTTNRDNAGIWYFKSTGTGISNEYYIYCLDGSTPKYLYAYENVLIKLDESNKTAFTVEETTNNAGTFYIYTVINGENCALSVRGIRNFFLEKRNNGANANERVTITTADPISDDSYGLNGKTYGLMNYTNGTSGYAVTENPVVNSGVSRLQALSMLVRSDPMDQSHMLYVANNSDIPMWTFQNISEDQYYLTTGDQYLRIEGNNVTLVATPDDYCKIKVIPGSDAMAGKVRLLGIKADRALSFDSSNRRFGSGNSSDSREWQNFVDLSVYSEDDFVQYSAYKVSVSDQVNVTNGKQIVIYTRVWDEENKGYHFYAVDHNGDLVPCYESGDAIVWIGAQNNTLLWEFTEYYNPGTTISNNYYELQNVYTEKYFAPQIAGGQIFSDNTFGINLNGRRYGDYYTTILAWDDSHYDYAGLKTENGKVVSCPMSQAEDFYFAVVEEPTPGELTPVATVDHVTLGLTMKMVNFDNVIVNGGNGTSPTTVAQLRVMGTQDYSEGAAQPGLLSTNLDNGYPFATKTGSSLYELFAGATPVNHLFIQSVYDGSGYYQFDSTENFAQLNGSGFDVYQELGTVSGTATTRKHGQFMPYNTLDSSKAHGENPYNTTDIYGNTLSDNYPRKNETLYGFNEAEDHYFGMEIEGHFMQTPNGLDAWGHDIIFEFVGDDDFWLYVDGELIIDLGGIHKALGGTVNYSTGQVVVNGSPTTLYALFKNNYATRNNLPQDDPAVLEYLDGIFQEKTVNGSTCYVFKDYSAHTVRIFYMERGGGASNLRMRFNLATVTPGQVLLTKEISGTEKQDYTSVKFPFQIYYQADPEEEYQLLSDGSNVVYQNTSTPVEYAESVTIDNVTYQNVFYLKPGQTAAINMPDNTIHYYIRECGVESEIYDNVQINGEDTESETPHGASSTRCYQSIPDSVAQRAKVTFSNHVDEEALRTLTVTKRLFDATGSELSAEQDPSGFTFRLSLGEGLDYYNQGDYFVKNKDGYYCKFDSDTNTFVSIGKKDFNLLTSEDLAQVTFRTSPSGAVSKIPAQYSVEVRDLLVGTKFKVVEEDYDIPVGYGKRIWTETEGGITKTYNGYKRVEGSYIVDQGDTENSGTIRDNSNPHIEVHNQRGWGIRADKVWSDKDFMLSHADTYFAVYVDNDLLGESVHRIDSYNYTTWYFNSLQSGKQFSDYNVREVILENPVIQDDGTITYSNITPVEPGDPITLGGIDYSVSYTQGQASGSAPGVSDNIRTDTVTNTRVGGLRVVKTDTSGNGLSGARFELKQNDTVIGSYTSADTGLVSTIYLENGTYKLIETNSPAGYQTLATSFTIGVNNGEFTVTGDETGGYHYNADTQTLTIQNRPFTLTVIKTDASKKEPLSGAHFALYKQITVTGGVRKDYYPMDGYEDIVTGDDGILNRIDQTLKAGTYYLTETQAPEDYILPDPVKDVCFTISNTGKITILSGEEYTGTIESLGTDPIEYVIKIPNRQDVNTAELAVSKTVTGDLGDTSKEFQFTVSGLESGEKYAYIRYTSTDGTDWTEDSGDGANGELTVVEVEAGNGIGIITFTLKHYQKIVITLPIDAVIEVSEENGIYKPTYAIDDGSSVTGNTASAITMYGDREVAFTNRLDAVSPTDYTAVTTPFLWILLAGLAALIGAVFPILCRKRK